MQRHIVLYDGTWNDPADRTTVFRLARYILDRDADGCSKRFKYDAGVGTDRLGKFLGGAFGEGLSRNLMEGYSWLAKGYREGDEIWIFSFSRGAFTARRLASLIRKCGLLDVYTPKLLTQAYRLYRDTAEAPEGEKARSFRENYSVEPDIHFIASGIRSARSAFPAPPSLNRWPSSGTISKSQRQQSTRVRRWR